MSRISAGKTGNTPARPVGTSGQSLRLEAIEINVNDQGYDLGIEYQTHTDTGVCVFFNPYEVASGSVGRVELIIPYGRTDLLVNIKTLV